MKKCSHLPLIRSPGRWSGNIIILKGGLRAGSRTVSRSLSGSIEKTRAHLVTLFRKKKINDCLYVSAYYLNTDIRYIISRKCDMTLKKEEKSKIKGDM